jgi:hypothetical protein
MPRHASLDLFASPVAMLAVSLLALGSVGAPVFSARADAAASLAVEDDRGDLERDLARIREVTKKFHDIEAAHKAGYPTTVPRCVESSTGGMGHHYAHPRLLDDRLDLEKPEILVYAPGRDGSLKLAGVEYIVPFSAWNRTDAPKIMGQALKRSDQLQLWYLHVWVWEENVNGVFADWNPAVKCPSTM